MSGFTRRMPEDDQDRTDQRSGGRDELREATGEGVPRGLTTIVEKTIKRGGEVPMSGLGKFRVAKRKARMGRNPATGEAIKIPAKTVVKFTVAKNLKDLVKKSK